MSTSKGLRGLIWDQIPESWRTVIVKNKIKNLFIDGVYNAIPKKKKGNNWRAGKTWLMCHGVLKYKYHLTYTIAPCTNKTKTFWQKIIDEIESYENACK